MKRALWVASTRRGDTPPQGDTRIGGGANSIAGCGQSKDGGEATSHPADKKCVFSLSAVCGRRVEVENNAIPSQCPGRPQGRSH